MYDRSLVLEIIRQMLEATLEKNQKDLQFLRPRISVD